MFAGYLHYKKLTSLRNDTRGRKTFRNINTFIRTLTVGIRSETKFCSVSDSCAFRARGLTTADKDFHLSPYREFIIAPSPPPVKTLFHKKL